MGQPWMLLRAAAILLVTRQTLALSDIFEDGKSDKEILDNLLRATRYDKRLLPPVQDADFCCGLQSPEDGNFEIHNIPSSSKQRETVKVDVSVLLLSLASPDESSLKYEVEFLLQQQWFDPRLKYSNQSRYDFLNAIHHHNDIWLPDTYFIMHGDFKDPLIPMHFSLRIYRNGTVFYSMRRHLILSCQGHLNIFPFDDPECKFSLESISYEMKSIKYVWKNDEDVLKKSASLATLNAYLIKNKTSECNANNNWRVENGNLASDANGNRDCDLCQKQFKGNYSCLGVTLIFTRDRAFYFTTVFIPGIILVTSSFITFWLEWNAVPARVMIGVTTMLNFFTTSNGFRSTLPVVSNLTAMNVWDGVCMCFIYASLLEFVCVNYVGRKRPLHNVVYRPGENPVIQGKNGPRFYQWLLIRLYVVWSVMLQRLPAVLSRIGIILASPLEFVTIVFGGPPSRKPFDETAEQEYYSTFCESPQLRGDKKRDSTGVANEIVSCTNCGPNPCTHTANNGCAAEVRKKEPPHPIRVAKTIDVIARITFPTAFAVFLIFFFYHYSSYTQSDAHQ